MYTSGSTGTPKGVILTHRNMTKTLNGFLYCLDPNPDDIYIAYLPLAHVLELVGGESMMIVWGVAIGYSHPNTLTDKVTLSHCVLQPQYNPCVCPVHYGEERREGRRQCAEANHHVLCSSHPGQDIQGSHGERQEEGGVCISVDGFLHQVQV